MQQGSNNATIQIIHPRTRSAFCTIFVHELGESLHGDTLEVAMYMLSYLLCKKASNHHTNLPLEMYSFTL